jgi:hypothetical protein
MAAEVTPVPAGTRRAALAFSALPTYHADEISHMLSLRERVRLRAGLSQIVEATTEERRAALQALVVATKQGPEWPAPTAHDYATCPFRDIETRPYGRVAGALEALAKQRPLHVAVTLCHLNKDTRVALWNRLSSEARNAVIVTLGDVPTFSEARTRLVARLLDSETKPEPVALTAS